MAQICESVDGLMEDCLSRIGFWIENYEIAVITAFGDRHRFVSDTGSAPYNKRLKATLIRLGYGVTPLHGDDIENLFGENPVKVSENSFLVVNINNDGNFYDRLFSLSEYYSQDSFLYKPVGTDSAFLIGTNVNGSHIGYNDSVDAGKMTYGLESMFMSRIRNNPSVFINSLISDNMLLETISECSRNVRWAIRVMSDEILRDISMVKNKNSSTATYNGVSV